MRRPCLGGHGYILSGQRCRQCEAERDTRRGSRQQRGYDEDHQRARAYLASTLPGPCGYGCGEWLLPESFVAAHVVDGQPEYGYVASCVRCNQRAKAGGGSKL